MLNGVLPVDKPEGPTSHDVVAAARRALGIRRIGHTGTLDPFASGLLLLCLGPATRLAEYLTALPKTYTATVRLGETTDTDDLTGEIIGRSDQWRDLTAPRIAAALAGQVGQREQLPPVYSAKKVQGERMYRAARRGETVERTPARVTIYSIEPLDVRLPDVDIRVTCSSGTYIRAIGRDLGADLDVGGHLTHLRRTRVAEHRAEDAVRLAQLADRDAVARRLLRPADAVPHLPRVVVDEQGRARLANGGAVAAPDPLPAGPLALCSADGELLAIGEESGGVIQPRKVFL